MTRVSEIATHAIQVLIDAERTAAKTLVTPVCNAAGYGAIGDGVTDDTVALQSWLDAIKLTKNPGYLPPATAFYKVTSTLTLAQGMGLYIFGGGQRPASDTVTGSSTIRWAGATGGTILKLTGVRQSRLESFNLDGNAIAGVIGLDFDAVNVTGNYVSTSDHNTGLGVFGCAVGVRIGNSHFQSDQSEWRSCYFQGNTVGVSILDSNAVWHTFRGCVWQANGTGITSMGTGSTGGHFDIISGKFVVNTVVDVNVYPARAFTMVACHSEGSARFLERGSFDTASNPGLLLGCSVNTITDVNAVGISWHGTSPLTIIGSSFRSGLATPFKIKTTQSSVPSSSPPSTIVVIGSVFDGQPFTGNSMVQRAEIAVLGSLIGGTLSDFATTTATRPHMGPDVVLLDNGSGWNASVATPATNNIRRSTATTINVASGAVLASGSNSFYIKSDIADGSLMCEVIDVTSWGGTNGESKIIGVDVVDNHATNANHLKVIVRTSAAVTLNGNLIFRLRLRSSTIQID